MDMCLLHTLDTRSTCRVNNLSVALPAHIYVDKCMTLRDAMKACETPQETLHELFTICQNVTKLLQVCSCLC